MTEFPQPNKSAVRRALAVAAYHRGEVRIAEPDLRDCRWLVPTARGLFGITMTGGVKAVLHGWFFGICEHAGQLYLFENCGQRDHAANLGRIIRLSLRNGRIAEPCVLVSGLHGNCHQIAVIADALCVVDTANQAIRRYALDGTPLGVQTPFPVAPPSDTSGAYLHVNSIAAVGNRIALLLHNGKAIPEKRSELAWLDADWNLIARVPLEGRMCHDIVPDSSGRLWHSASASGEVIRSDGLRIKVSHDMMTRGIGLLAEGMAVGICTFGPRHVRGTLNGAVVLLDAEFRVSAEIIVPGPPAGILALPEMLSAG